MNQSTHTPGPWAATQHIGHKDQIGVTADADPCIIAIMGNQRAWPLEAKANAARIVACVNACEGINPEAVPDLLHIAKCLLAMVEAYAPDMATVNGQIEEFKAMIATAEGR